jgi:hypothetical protein
MLASVRKAVSRSARSFAVRASVEISAGCGKQRTFRACRPFRWTLHLGRRERLCRPKVPVAAMKRFVNAKPYNWPYDGSMSPDNTAMIVIDMQVRELRTSADSPLRAVTVPRHVQVDFCGKGGYVDRMGYDVTLTQAPIPHIKCAPAYATVPPRWLTA